MSLRLLTHRRLERVLGSTQPNQDRTQPRVARSRIALGLIEFLLAAGEFVFEAAEGCVVHHATQFEPNN